MKGRVVNVLKAFLPGKLKWVNNQAPGKPMTRVSKVDREAWKTVNLRGAQIFCRLRSENWKPHLGEINRLNKASKGW
jgi:hypothetical protein